MTRSSVEKRLELYVGKASEKYPSLRNRNVSPHTLRHTTAMHLLQSGVDITVISMWLGHEDVETTNIYITADIRMKEKALKSLQEPKSKNFRYKPSDSLLAFLENM